VQIPGKHHLAQVTCPDPGDGGSDRLLPLRRGLAAVAPEHLGGRRNRHGRRKRLVAVGDGCEPRAAGPAADHGSRDHQHRPVRGGVEGEAAEGHRSGARDADVISDARAVEKLAQPLFRRGEPVLACRERYLRGLAPSGQPFAAPDPGQRRGMRQAAQQVTGISDGDGADSQPVRHPLACAIVL
jgi:hypothetical protein